MTLKAAAIAILVCGLSSPAFATEWVNCSDAGEAATFSYLAGTLDVLSVTGMTISVGNQVWASDVAYGPGDPVAVGQAFQDSEQILIDAINPDATKKIAELRLFKAEEGDSGVIYSGTLKIAGHGAWAVSCSGP